MAHALAATVGQSLKATHGKTEVAGWEKFVKGCVVTLDFGAPIDIAVLATAGETPVDFQQVLVTKLQDSARPTQDGTHTLGGGIDISVGGHWSF
jgi:hypothetical protein